MNPFKAPPRQQLLGDLQLEDLLAPLAGADRPFLLESGLNSSGIGRWHLLGAFPVGEFLSVNGRWRCSIGPEEDDQVGEGDPLEALDNWWQRWKGPGADSSIPFAGGAVGYLGYEAGDPIQRVEGRYPEAGPAADFFAQAPDIHLHLYDEVVAIDTLGGTSVFLHRGREGQEKRRWWQEEGSSVKDPGIDARPLEVSIPDARYLEAIEEIRQRIGNGEVYEVNLTRGLLLEDAPDPWLLHHRWRQVQPVPFAALLPWSPISVVSASPESFLRRRGSTIETRPIKGTIARGNNLLDDRKRGEQLLADEKERAELAMIVDLERNDLGKICLPGTVEVTEEASIETYSSVLHTVATIEGQLRGHPSPVDLLRATFPGGSITGAPKSAAVACIADLEPWPRKVYTGSIGWIAADGDLDLSIAIRTAMLRGDRAVISLGGAITWDSVADKELLELAAKGETILQALGCLP